VGIKARRIGFNIREQVGAQVLQWHQSVFELIDMRSFSNLWFWIALAVLWSTTSHWVLGVPYDLIQRAGRKGGQAMEDLHDLTRVNVNRILFIAGQSGTVLMVFVPFVVTVLGLLGFFYRVEFCQALFLMALPLSIVAALSWRTAYRIQTHGFQDETLIKTLRRHRMAVQAVAMLAIFSTGMWGMYQLLSVGVMHS